MGPDAPGDDRAVVPPPSFDEDHSSDWSVHVLDHGLPALPPRVEPGESVPVARWAGPRFGSVVHLGWAHHDDPDDRYLAVETELFRRSPDGWEEADGSGGTDWPHDPPLQRPTLPPRYAALGGETGFYGNGWSCCAVEGLAGSDAAVVEVVDGDGTTRRPLDTALGIVVVALDPTRPATITVLDGQGLVLARHRRLGSRP